MGLRNLWLSVLCASALVVAAPALAAEGAAEFGMPLIVSPGMPRLAGTFALRANGALMGAAGPAMTQVMGTSLDAFLGLTDQLGINVRTGYVQTGPSLGIGFWRNTTLEGQYAVIQTADKVLGLSIVGGAFVPGGPGGLQVGGIQPSVGLRGTMTGGPAQGNVEANYRPVEGIMEYGVSAVMAVTPAISPTIDLQGSTSMFGGAPSLSLAPGVSFRLTPGIRLGAGYVIPVTGSPANAETLLAHLQLGI